MKNAMSSDSYECVIINRATFMSCLTHGHYIVFLHLFCIALHLTDMISPLEKGKKGRKNVCFAGR